MSTAEISVYVNLQLGLADSMIEFITLSDIWRVRQSTEVLLENKLFDSTGLFISFLEVRGGEGEG